VDEAIEETEKLIAKHQQIKAGLMHDLFTRGLAPDGHLRPPHKEAPHLYKDSPLGPIPKEWAVRRLEERIRVIDCKHYTPAYSEEGFPVIRPRNIEVDGLDLSDVEHVSRDEYRTLTETHKPQRGDIVFARNASFGIPCYVDTDLEFAIGQDVVIMTKSVSDTPFVFCALCSEGVSRQIARASGGSTFGRINLHEIRNLLVPCPKSDEQESIGERIFAAREHLESLGEDANKRRSQKGGLMHDLLTGEVQVDTLLEAESGAASSSRQDAKEGG
jgi:type I restriction enzyme, S subunit